MNKIELTNCDCEILKQQNAFIMNNDLFQKYYEMRPIDCQYCNMFGKKIPVPRRCKSYGANYKFNGSSDNEKTEPFDESMELMSEIIAKSLNCEKPNNCLVNWYADGDEYIGYHQDVEKTISNNKSVCIYSFGAERKMKFKNINNNKVDDVVLENNSLFIMLPETNEKTKHSIPKSKKIKNARISFSFRWMK